MTREITFAVKAPNWLGDAVMALPAVSGLIECSRRGRVLIIGSPSSAGLYSRLDGVLAYGVTQPGGGVLRSLASIVKGSTILRSLRPVLILSFTRSFTSAATCFLGRVPRRIGFGDSAGSFLYTDEVRRRAVDAEHLIDVFNQIVESIGIKVESRIPELQPLESDIGLGRAMLRAHGLREGGYVCLFPGARYGPAKMWPAHRFALLGDSIADKFNLDIVIAGGRKERSACHAVESLMSRRAVNLCGNTDLAALIGILRLSGGVVSNDSGGMHLGAALGAPVVGLFFSTDPVWTGPVSKRSMAIYHRMECSPCFERDCSRGNICTASVEVAEVLEALDRIMRIGD